MTPEERASNYALSKTQGSDIGFKPYDRIYNAHLAGQNCDKWVKVEDRLPEIYTEVLAWNSRKEFMSVASYYEGYWHYSDSFDTLADITHWQPLPKAPKE